MKIEQYTSRFTIRIWDSATLILCYFHSDIDFQGQDEKDRLWNRIFKCRLFPFHSQVHFTVEDKKKLEKLMEFQFSTNEILSPRKKSWDET